MTTTAPLRDTPLLDHTAEANARTICDWLRSDPRTAERLSMGILTPIEIARAAVLALPIDPRTNYPEGTISTCIHCDDEILLDQREGGGPGKDWGSSPEDWIGNGGIGMDYGCGEHPLSGPDGCWGHEPDHSDIIRPDA